MKHCEKTKKNNKENSMWEKSQDSIAENKMTKKATTNWLNEFSEK